MNALFLSSRWIDGATVTASSSQGLLTADHVQTIRPDQVWRATGCAAEWLAWDFGVARDVDAAVVLAHNLSADATLRLRLAATAADVTAAPAVDTGVVSAWPTSGKPTSLDWQSWFSLLLFAPTGDGGFILAETGDPLLDENGDPIVAEDDGTITDYRYGRLDIADPTNPDGFVQVGRFYVGPAFVPAINVDINPSIGLISPDEVGRTAFGHAYGDNRGPAARVLQVPMSAIDKDEMGEEMFELQRYCGLAKDFAFCLDPAETTAFHIYALQARFAALNGFQAQPAFNETGKQVWQTTLALEEIL